jgi:branched-chain amino acid transport system permease protein
MFSDRASRTIIGLLVVLLIAGPFLPKWAMFLLNVSLSWGAVVLGMMLLMRTGLVSFGQGCTTASAPMPPGRCTTSIISDILVMLLASFFVAALVAAILGLLLAKYRDIFSPCSVWRSR